jgi:hypothetical protein
MGRDYLWAIPLVLLPACSDYPTHFGPPDGLVGRELPAPVGVDAAASPDASPSSPTDGSALLPDGGSCSVSWGSQLFPNMTASGAWKCGSSSCHGGFQAPKVTASASATYANFAAYTLTPPAPALPYILPRNTDPTKSGIECNLSGTSCGNQMPLATGGAQLLTASQIAMIDTWVKCGAPDN